MHCLVTHCFSCPFHYKNKYGVSQVSSGAFGDWIILFSYAGRLKRVFPLSRKNMSLFIYGPRSPSLIL